MFACKVGYQSEQYSNDPTDDEYRGGYAFVGPKLYFFGSVVQGHSNDGA